MSITLSPQVAEILPMLKALPTAEKLEIIHAITLSEDSKQMVDDTVSEWAFLDKIHAIGEPDPSFEGTIKSLKGTSHQQADLTDEQISVIDERLDDVANGQAKIIDGEAIFARLREKD